MMSPTQTFQFAIGDVEPVKGKRVPKRQIAHRQWLTGLIDANAEIDEPVHIALTCL